MHKLSVKAVCAIMVCALSVIVIDSCYVNRKNTGNNTTASSDAEKNSDDKFPYALVSPDGKVVTYLSNIPSEEYDRLGSTAKDENGFSYYYAEQYGHPDMGVGVICVSKDSSRKKSSYLAVLTGYSVIRKDYISQYVGFNRSEEKS